MRKMLVVNAFWFSPLFHHLVRPGAVQRDGEMESARSSVCEEYRPLFLSSLFSFSFSFGGVCGSTLCSSLCNFDHTLYFVSPRSFLSRVSDIKTLRGRVLHGSPSPISLRSLVSGKSCL